MASRKKDKGPKSGNNQQVSPQNNTIGHAQQYSPNYFLPLQMPQHSPNMFPMINPSLFNSWQSPNSHHNMQNSMPQYPNQKVCLLCKREPRFTCARCEAYYCSQDCQRKDWQSHRFWCFAMPPLVPINAVSRTTPPIAALPKNQSIVLLTGFRRPNLCYVRSMEPADKDQFLKATTTINNYGTSALYMTELPASNTYAIAFYERQYNRVQVLSASSEDGIRVLFIDKGFVKTLQIRDLRRATDNVIRILQQAVAIKLKGVENYMMTNEIEQFLSKFCEKEFRLEYNEDNGDKEFVLKELNSENILNECISSLANKQTNVNVYADFKIAENTEKAAVPKKNEKELKAYLRTYGEKIESKPVIPVLKPPFDIMQFDERDQNFCVTVLNRSRIEYGLFGCIVRNSEKYLDRTKAYLRIYVDPGTIYEPQLNEYCLAQIEEQWCRIKILNIDKNIYTVVNIDTTAEEKIKCDKIRRYPDMFNVPCATVLCKIKGLLPISGNKMMEDFMKQRFTINSQHRINKVKKIENGICYVQMDDLIDELILDLRVNVK